MTTAKIVLRPPLIFHFAKPVTSFVLLDTSSKSPGKLVWQTLHQKLTTNIQSFTHNMYLLTEHLVFPKTEILARRHICARPSLNETSVWMFFEERAMKLRRPDLNAEPPSNPLQTFPSTFQLMYSLKGHVFCFAQGAEDLLVTFSFEITKMLYYKNKNRERKKKKLTLQRKRGGAFFLPFPSNYRQYK